MSDNPVTMTELEDRRLDWTANHLREYLGSGGVKGHITTLEDLGGYLLQTTLLLRTVGRKTGAARIVPLVYGDIGGEALIVGSKAGADVHPAWYFNLIARAEIDFQIATQAFSGTWREPVGEEREAMWAFIRGIYPPYQDYRHQTVREIPLILLRPVKEIPVFTLAEAGL